MLGGAQAFFVQAMTPLSQLTEYPVLSPVPLWTHDYLPSSHSVQRGTGEVNLFLVNRSMARITLWNPIKTNDYDFMDGVVGEHLHAGGTGVYVHRYLGVHGDAEYGSDETAIQDVLFLENRDRKYDETIYELRGSYNPGDSDFDLTQFGLFLANDNLFMTFHINSMVDQLGRKLMSGDVIELPHLRDDLLLDQSGAVNRFFVVTDGGRPSEGFSPRWWPHLWRVKLSGITDSSEYRDILGTGENADDLRNLLSSYKDELAISDKISEIAAQDVPYHPQWRDNAHLYYDETLPHKPGIHVYADGDQPPNGISVVGTGETFPVGAAQGDYFLRTDFSPNRLFQKSGDTWVKISDDHRQVWNAANRVLQTFINNDDVRVNTDGTTGNVKTNLSEVVRPRAD